jgi:hypothetical protein
MMILHVVRLTPCLRPRDKPTTPHVSQSGST